MTALILALAATAAMSHGGPEKASSIYDFTMSNIDSHTVKLSHYKGKVLLVVNVASKCGYTPQYAGLEQLYKEYKSQGFVILGFPANNFGEQEPGSNTEIKQFCTANYNVTFPMFSKISVKGADESSLYKWLIASSDRPSDDIEWNFSKFLIGKDGKVIKRFKSADTPESSDVKSAIEAALKS